MRAFGGACSPLCILASAGDKSFAAQRSFMVFVSSLPGAKTKTLARVREDGGGRVRLAVFQSGCYQAGMADILKKEGFFAVAIEDPAIAEIREHKDFILAPELVRWLMPTPETTEAWIASLQSGHHRNLLKKRLKIIQGRREELRVEVRPLTVSDYRIWHDRLYRPIIGAKRGAILYWPRAEFLSKRAKATAEGAVVNFLRIFIYRPNGDLIGGSLWQISPSQGMLAVVAAAFEQKTRAGHELSALVLEEAIHHADAHRLRWTSYGSDPNLYGVDVGLGLQAFKAGTGMKPVLRKAGGLWLLKILDENLSQIRSDAGEPSVLVFTLGGDDPAEREAAFQRQPPQAQRGNPDLVWRRRHDLKPIRFAARPPADAVIIPEGMMLQDRVLIS